MNGVRKRKLRSVVGDDDGRREGVIGELGGDDVGGKKVMLEVEGETAGRVV